MATINISDLSPIGSKLFSDSESYMSELGDSEINIINGGATTSGICLAISTGLVVESLIKLSNPLNSF